MEFCQLVSKDVGVLSKRLGEEIECLRRPEPEARWNLAGAVTSSSGSCSSSLATQPGFRAALDLALSQSGKEGEGWRKTRGYKSRHHKGEPKVQQNGPKPDGAVVCGGSWATKPHGPLLKATYLLGTPYLKIRKATPTSTARCGTISQC